MPIPKALASYFHFADLRVRGTGTGVRDTFFHNAESMNLSLCLLVSSSLPLFVPLTLPLSAPLSLRLFDSKKDPHVRCISAATKPFPLGRGWGRPLSLSLSLLVS